MERRMFIAHRSAALSRSCVSLIMCTGDAYRGNRAGVLIAPNCYRSTVPNT
jgi:hypothetical protein